MFDGDDEHSILSDLKSSTLIIILLDIKNNSEYTDTFDTKNLINIKLSNLLLADQVLEELITKRYETELVKEAGLVSFANIVSDALKDLVKNLEKCDSNEEYINIESDNDGQERIIH